MSYILLFAAGLLIYISWQAIYRLFLHPLARVPGPWLPALTGWYETYFDVVLPGQYVFKIKDLHEKYGPIIRPVPNEVHISDVDFLDTIYASRNRHHAELNGLMVDESMGAAKSIAQHNSRREALNPYFSQKAILLLEPLLSAKRDKVTGILDRTTGTSQPVNLSDVFFAFSNDLVRSYSFGKDNGLLNNLSEANTQRENLSRLLRTVKISRNFPFVPRVMGKLGVVPPGIMDLIRFRGQIGRDIEAVLADKTNDKRGEHSVFYEIRDTPLLPPEEKTASRLRDEATLLVMAGTESTAKSLNIATFYLTSLPEVLRGLRQELHSAKRESGNEHLSLSTLLALPYLGAVIFETNRLSFGVTGRMQRIAPDETITYTASYGPHKGETYVFPPGTPMSTVTYCTHTNESLFPDPRRFDPSRWLGGGEEVTRRKRSMHALGKGYKRCIGVNVANAALSLGLAAISEYDLTLFETDESDIKFQHDFQISFPRLDTKGVQVIVDGKHTL